MMKYLILILSGIWSFSLPSPGEVKETPHTAVSPIQWKQFDLTPLDDERSLNIRRIIANSHKFALNEWFHKIKKFDSQNGEYLDFGGKTEHFIRPVSHQAFGLAFALKWNIYDEKTTGVPAQTAKERTVLMIKSLCYRHKANSPNGWGDAWQSALWASQTALASWFMWDDLDKETRQLAVNMLVHEANRFNDYKVPYYKDRTGKVIYKGDSKAEENAWNSNILATACVMLPRHPNWKVWNRKAIELQISGYSLPDDWKRNKTVNGFNYKELQGSNIEEDGLVINHGIIHPDYMVAIMHNATNGWFYRLGGMDVPAACLTNGDVVYHALTDLKVKDGKTIYVQDGEGNATPNMFFPQGNDWGTYRQANYWLMDVMAEVYRWDRQSTVKARNWALVRETKMLEMQARGTTGQFYQSPRENSFASREEMIPFQLALGYLGLWEQKHGMIRITDKPLSPPARR